MELVPSRKPLKSGGLIGGTSRAEVRKAKSH